MTAVVVGVIVLVAVIVAVKLTNWSYWFRMMFGALCQAFLWAMAAGVALTVLFAIYVL